MHRIPTSSPPPEAPRESNAPTPLTDPENRAFYEHELQIHQIELEMQNDELRAAHADIAGSDGRIRAANRAACQILGVAPGAVIRRYFRSFVTEGDRLGFSDFLAKLANSFASDSVSREVSVRRQEKASRVRLCGTVQYDPEFAILIGLEDVTVMREAQRALNEADQRKDEFIAVLSHELRNPLMAIMTAIALAQQAEVGHDRTPRALGVIATQVTSLQKIVNDLTDVSRLTRGRVVLQLQRLDLHEWLQRVVEDWRLVIEKKPLRLDFRLDPHDLWIDGDVIRLNQVVGNLLGNSIKFTSPGGTIAVNLQRSPQQYAELHISDTGRGMSRDELEHAFEPFCQTNQADDRPYGGLGLGLPIVKQLVELHSGTVAIASQGPRARYPRLDPPAAPGGS